MRREFNLLPTAASILTKLQRRINDAKEARDAIMTAIAETQVPHIEGCSMDLQLDGEGGGKIIVTSPGHTDQKEDTHAKD